MLIYQVKITIDASVEAEWLQWMRSQHVPDVMATGLPVSCQILKAENPEHTYFFQYHFNNEKDLKQYQEVHAPGLKAHPEKKFPNLFSVERSILHGI